MAISTGALEFTTGNMKIDFMECEKVENHGMRGKRFYLGSFDHSRDEKHVLFSLWCYDDEETNTDIAIERKLSKTI